MSKQDKQDEPWPWPLMPITNASQIKFLDDKIGLDANFAIEQIGKEFIRSDLRNFWAYFEIGEEQEAKVEFRCVKIKTSASKTSARQSRGESLDCVTFGLNTQEILTDLAKCFLETGLASLNRARKCWTEDGEEIAEIYTVIKRMKPPPAGKEFIVDRDTHGPGRVLLGNRTRET
jgi:hypothetical protein